MNVILQTFWKRFVINSINVSNRSKFLTVSSLKKATNVHGTLYNTEFLGKFEPEHSGALQRTEKNVYVSKLKDFRTILYKSY
jgi:hypothetical protein